MAFMIAKSILQQHFNTLNDYMDLKDYSCMRSICKVLQQLCPPASSMVKTHLCWGCKPGSDKQCSFAPKHMVASMKLCGCHFNKYQNTPHLLTTLLAFPVSAFKPQLQVPGRSEEQEKVAVLSVVVQQNHSKCSWA